MAAAASCWAWAAMKCEIRSSKSETNPNKAEQALTKTAGPCGSVIALFRFRICFGFRASDFGFCIQHPLVKFAPYGKHGASFPHERDQGDQHHLARRPRHPRRTSETLEATGSHPLVHRPVRLRQEHY